MRKIDVVLESLMNSEVQRLTFAYNQSRVYSESTFGFERYADVEHLTDIATRIGDNCPSLNTYTKIVKCGGSVETDYNFDFAFERLGRAMLIRDSFKMLRLIAWSEDGSERYKLYTKSFAQFADAVYNITGGQARPTEYVWSNGDVVNLVGPVLTLPDTPSVSDFEQRILGVVRTSFEEEMQRGSFGMLESELWSCKAAIEQYVNQLSKVSKMFTPF